MNAVLLDSRVASHSHEPLLPPRPGWVDVVPVLSALLRLADERWQGTAVVRDATGCALGALRFAAGSIRAARLTVDGKLMQGLVGLCSGWDCSLEALDATQLQERELAPIELDILQLTAAVMRGPVHEGRLYEALQALDRMELQLGPQADLSRYRFEPYERRAVACLQAEPIAMHELLQRAALPEPKLQRLLYALWLTRALSVRPPGSRMLSEPVLRTHPASVSMTVRRNDEPTTVVLIASAPWDDATPELRRDLPAVDDSQTLARPRPAQRTRSAQRDPDPIAAGRYHLQDHECAAIEAPFVATNLRSRRTSLQPLAASDERSASFEADVHFRVAARLLQRGNVREAVFEAQKAMLLCAPRPEQQALYAWLLYQRSGGARDVPASVWEHLEHALLCDRTCAQAYYYKGMVLKATAQPTAALWHFERTLEFDPNHREADWERRALAHTLSK